MACFVNKLGLCKLKLIYFGNLTQRLFYNCIAIVDLEVTLT